MRGTGLLTDLYELNMAVSYLRRGMTGLATFSLFVRRLPPNRGFLVAAGLEDCLRHLEGFGFGPDDLDYLAGAGFDRRAIEDLGRLRFTGDVWAVPEGTLVFADEPIVEITAPIAEAQVVETFLLNQVTFQTTLATKAARCRVAAAGRIDLVDFSLRRTQGIEASLAVARLATMVGFVATSNVEAARRFALTPAGTMAHSYIEAFPTELAAFRAFAEDLPDRTTFLVDTYDTFTGIQHAIAVIQELGLEEHAGIRLDSGDLPHLAVDARRRLDAAGLPRVRIFVSGGLDEYALEELVARRVPVDAAGVGTRLGVSDDAPFLESAYKLVDYDGRPVVKLSADKASLPGAKQVFRTEGLADLLGLRDEAPPPGTVPLLAPVMRDGRRTGPATGLDESRSCFERDLARLPAEARALGRPRAPEPRLTPALAELTDRVRAAALPPQ